jgi:hypothetical protein
MLWLNIWHWHWWQGTREIRFRGCACRLATLDTGEHVSGTVPCVLHAAACAALWER